MTKAQGTLGRSREKKAAKETSSQRKTVKRRKEEGNKAW